MMKTFFLAICSTLGIIASSIEIMNYLERTAAKPAAVVSNPPPAPVSVPSPKPVAVTPVAPTTPTAPAAAATSVANRPALPPLPRLPPVKAMMDTPPVPKMNSPINSPIFEPWSAPPTARQTERRPSPANAAPAGKHSPHSYDSGAISGTDGW